MAKLRKEYKSLYVVVFFLFITAFFYFFYAVPFEKGKLERSKEKYATISILPGDVHKIEIKNKYGMFGFMKNINSWQIISPMDVKADDYELNNIINYFEEIKIRKLSNTITESELVKYGLSNPGILVSLWKDNSDKILQLNIGDLTPDGMGVYGYTDEPTEIIVLPMYLTILLNKDLYELRDKTAFSFNVDRVKQIKIQFTASELILNKVEEGNWLIEEPIRGVSADRNEVENLLNQLKWVDIIEFFNGKQPDLMRVGLDYPWAIINIVLKDPFYIQSVSFGYVNEKDGIYARNNTTGEVFLLPIEITRLFMEDIYLLRDKSVFGFNHDEITSLQLDYPGDKDDIKIIKTVNNDWEITSRAVIKADSDAVENYLSELRSIKSKKYLPANECERKKCGFKKPKLKISLKGPQSSSKILYIGEPYPDNSDLIFAKLDHRDEIILLEKGSIENLKKNQKYFEYRHLFQFNIGDVYKIELLYKNLETTVQRVKEDKWQIIFPKKDTINRFPILLLLRDLWRLKSEEKLSEDAIREMQEQPDIIIKLWMESDENPVMYHIWNYELTDNVPLVAFKDDILIVNRDAMELIKRHISQVIAQTR